MIKTSNIKFLGITLPMLLMNFVGISQTNYYVNDNSATGDIYCSSAFDGSGDGSAGDPYNTLLNVFANHNLGSGDTIFVDAGSYSESFSSVGSNDEGFVVKGASEALTVFDGAEAMFFMSITSSGNDDIKFQDFTIKNYGTTTTNRSGSAFQIGGSISDLAITGLEFYNLTFDDCDGRNTNSSYGGAFAINNYASGSSMTIDSCIFMNNDAGAGACISNHASSGDNITLTVTNTTFHSNTNPQRCAVYRESNTCNTTLTMESCVMYNNTSARTLNFMYGTGTHTFTNCLIYENTVTDATEKGVFEPYQTTLNLRNCTVVDNDGGGVYVPHTGSTVNIYSCIIQDNTSQNDIHQASNGTVNVYNTIYNTKDGTYSFDTDTDNETADATFVDASGDDYQLAASSNGIDEGENTGAPADDLLGATRDANVDMGAYEYGALVLPIELMSWEVEYNDFTRTFEFTWVSAMEFDADRYEIEWSDDGYTWQVLTDMKAEGYSVSYQEYEYESIVDFNEPFVYFRLVQYDYDGTREVFKTHGFSIVTGPKYKEIIGIYTVDGRQLFRMPYNQTVIIIYSDGTNEKAIQVNYGN